MPGRLLPEIITIWPGVTAKIKKWKEHIERLDRWSWGPGFTVFEQDGGRVVSYIPPDAGVFLAVATSIITARVTNTAGSGTFKMRDRSGAALTDGTTGLTVYSNFSTAVASGKAIVVAREGSGYILVSADCP